MSFPRYLALALGAAALASGMLLANPRVEPPPKLLIGYTELRTNLPGGRHGNVTTMRAVVVEADGTDRRVLAEELTREKHSWTQFAGWSPDGKWLAYGSKRGGIRQLYLMRLDDKRERRLTDLAAGQAAMWPHWQPAASKP